MWTITTSTLNSIKKGGIRSLKGSDGTKQNALQRAVCQESKEGKFSLVTLSQNGLKGLEIFQAFEIL